MEKCRFVFKSFPNKNVFKYIFIIKFLILVSILAGINLSATEFRYDVQQLKIIGTVKDESENPMPGVNIQVEGSTLGVISDTEGKYSIEIPDRNAVLIFSFIGYIPQRIPTEGKTVIDLTMVPETQALGEVVVIGYGIQKKVNVVGSISQISSEQFVGRSVPLLSNALTGQMTGVSVITRSGAPGTSSGTIRVRGVGSFGATPDALVLIDGIPGNINDVRPEEVESVSVLKDASSAAIYGARAANGVILITTKTGKFAKVKVNYNAYYGFVTPTALPNY